MSDVSGIEAESGKRAMRFAVEIIFLYLLALLMTYFTEAMVQVPLTVRAVDSAISYPYTILDMAAVLDKYSDATAKPKVPLADLFTVFLYVCVNYFTLAVKYILPFFVVGTLAWVQKKGRIRDMSWEIVAFSAVAMAGVMVFNYHAWNIIQSPFFD